jgi:hypothetical protein
MTRHGSTLMEHFTSSKQLVASSTLAAKAKGGAPQDSSPRPSAFIRVRATATEKKGKGPKKTTESGRGSASRRSRSDGSVRERQIAPGAHFLSLSVHTLLSVDIHFAQMHPTNSGANKILARLGHSDSMFYKMVRDFVRYELQ